MKRGYTKVGILSSSGRSRYESPVIFFEALKKQEPSAIVELRDRIWPALLRWGKSAGTPNIDLEEIVQDALVLSLRKIESGQYQFLGTDPAAFTAVIAQNLLRNFLRKKQPHLNEIGEWDKPADDDIETYLNGKDIRRQIAELMEKIPGNCRNLLRLHYFDELDDKEILARKLTTYSTIESLRSKRCECLKKLAMLMECYKHQLLEK
jgi:RNA polymerase sigma factor (sigma-70 family)